MNLYCAGNVSTVGGIQDPALHDTGLRHRLLSFAEIDESPGQFAFWLDSALRDKRVFLDSGAFGAYTRKITIDIQALSKFALANAAELTCVAALDVIGDWQTSAANWAAMRATGLDPIATFHRRSPWHALDAILDSGASYIALGGIASEGPTRADLQPWLDGCWRRIARRWPMKVHGFGLTAQWALERYPFHSADSSAALVGAGFGRVLRFEDGVMRSRNYVEQARATYDGAILDGVGHEKSAYARRRQDNVQAFAKFERYLTDLWRARGIAWDGPSDSYTGKAAA